MEWEGKQARDEREPTEISNQNGGGVWAKNGWHTVKVLSLRELNSLPLYNTFWPVGGTQQDKHAAPTLVQDRLHRSCEILCQHLTWPFTTLLKTTPPQQEKKVEPPHVLLYNQAQTLAGKTQYPSEYRWTEETWGDSNIWSSFLIRYCKYCNWIHLLPCLSCWAQRALFKSPWCRASPKRKKGFTNTQGILKTVYNYNIQVFTEGAPIVCTSSLGRLPSLGFRGIPNKYHTAWMKDLILWKIKYFLFSA